MRDLVQQARSLEPTSVLVQIAAGRVAIGLMLTLAPRWCWRQLTRGSAAGDGGHGAALAVRMLGVRDLALGLGGVLTARRGGALRGWGEAAVLADATDAAAFATSPALSGWRRVAAALAAGVTAAAGLLAARQT